MMNTIIACAKRQWSNTKLPIPIELIMKIIEYLCDDTRYDLYMNYKVWGTTFRNALILNRLYMPKMRRILPSHSIARTMLAKYYCTNYQKLKHISKIIYRGHIDNLMKYPYNIYIDDAKRALNLCYHNYTSFKRILKNAVAVNFMASEYLIAGNKIFYAEFLQYFDIKKRYNHAYDYDYNDKCDYGEMPTIIIDNVHDKMITNLPKCSMVYIKNCSNLYLNASIKNCKIEWAKNIIVENQLHTHHAHITNSDNIHITNDIDDLYINNCTKTYFDYINLFDIDDCTDIFIKNTKTGYYGMNTGLYVRDEVDHDSDDEYYT